MYKWNVKHLNSHTLSIKSPNRVRGKKTKKSCLKNYRLIGFNFLNICLCLKKKKWFLKVENVALNKF